MFVARDHHQPSRRRLAADKICRSYGAPGFYIAGGCYKHFAPNGAMNPRLVQPNKLWDSSGTSFGTNKSIDVNSYDFCPRKIKKIFFRIVFKEQCAPRVLRT